MKDIDLSDQFQEVDFLEEDIPFAEDPFIPSDEMADVSLTPDDFDYREELVRARQEIPVEEYKQEYDVEGSLGETLQIDPLAVLEPFGIDVMDPIETGIPYSSTERLLRYIANPPAAAAVDALGLAEHTNKEISAALAGWGHGMLDITRGVKQLLDIDIQEEKTNEAIMNDLYSDEEYKEEAIIGSVGGILTEPIGVLLPGAKARSVRKALVVGAATGGIFGFTGYVDEEGGESRALNTGMGVVTGTILGGIMTYAVNKLTKTVDGRKFRKAHRAIREFEEEYARLISEGHTISEANAVIKETNPGLIPRVREASDLLQIKPDLPSTKKAADEVLSFYSGGHKTYSGSQLDKAIGMLHTRVKLISEPVAANLRRMEFNIHTRAQHYSDIVDPFRNVYKSLGSSSKDIVNKSLINSDFKSARKEIRRVVGPEGVKAFDDAISVFDELGSELKAAGVIDGEISNYWHRSVKDVKGLLRAIGSTKGEAKNIATQLAEKNKAVRAARGYEMTPFEEAVFIQGRLNNDKHLEMIGYANKRGISKVNESLLKYYANPIESLDSYIHNAIWDVEKARFLGPKNLRISEKNLFDPEHSINAWAKNYEAIKNLSPDEMRELKGVLKARFGVGQQAASKTLKSFKVFTYSALLGNPLAAATQFGDLGTAVYKNGLRRSIKAAIKSTTGRADIKVKDLGLVDQLVQEFSDAQGGEKALNFFMKYGGFQTVDRLGKSVLVNGALEKFARASMNRESKEFIELASKYRVGWGREFHKLVKDLQVYEMSKNPKDITDNIRFLVWNELSDVQPISLSEVPEHYLNMPNGKIVYMLKTFTLKQLDIIRRDGIQQIKAGNTAAGVKNLTKYLMIMGGANLGVDTLRDLALGRESKIQKLEDIPGEYISSIFKTFGITEYLRTQAKKDGPLSAAAQILVPPVNVLDDIFYKSWAQSEPHPEKVIKHVPIVGRVLAEGMKE